MPAIVHLQPRFLESGESQGISATAIGLIVGIGLVPSIILIWVVCFLFFAYPNDRNFCCMKRKKRKDDTAEMQETKLGTETSQETLYEQAPIGLPKQPYSAYSRTEFGNGTGRLTKDRPATGATQADTRMSLQSVGSASTVHGVQEPRPYI